MFWGQCKPASVNTILEKKNRATAFELDSAQDFCSEIQFTTFFLFHITLHESLISVIDLVVSIV